MYTLTVTLPQLPLCTQPLCHIVTVYTVTLSTLSHCRTVVVYTVNPKRRADDQWKSWTWTSVCLSWRGLFPWSGDLLTDDANLYLARPRDKAAVVGWSVAAAATIQRRQFKLCKTATDLFPARYLTFPFEF